MVAVDYLATLQGQDLDAIEYVQAGGGLSHGVIVGGFREIARVPTAEEVAEMYKAAMAALEPRVYHLSEYLNSPSVVARGHRIPRRLVVKYVRNRLGGGGHLGLTEYKDSEFFDVLDDAVAGREAAGRPAVYYEVLTIGQTIGQSHDARELRQAIGARLS